MYKYRLILLLLLISLSTSAQLSLSTKYDHIMDSTSIYNINLRYTNQSNDYVDTYVLRNVKITFSTRINEDEFNIDGNDVDSFNDDDITDEYLSIFKYDVRAKFYLTRDLRLTTRTLIMGSRYKTNQYSTGFIIKF